MSLEYQILSAKDIDKKKWDSCVSQNENGLIYARSDYLDNLSPNWKGIVFKDYKAIFPLCIKKKWGIKYLYRPLFCQQLGLIGKADIDLNTLLKIIHKEVKYGDIVFNYANKEIVPFQAKEKTNFIIDLSNAYSQIFNKYKYNLKSDLIKSRKNRLQIKNGQAQEALLAYEKFLYAKTNKNYHKEIDCFLKLLQSPKFENKYFVRKVTNAHSETLAISLFLINKKRIYNLISTTFYAGKEVNAMQFLIDNVIREYERTDLIFDFEGSDLPGVKNFYLKFSPQYQPYYHFHFNNLPFPLNFLKR